MKESDFQHELTRSIPWLENQLGEALGFFKIPDMPRGPSTHYSVPKAFDCFLVRRGRFIAMELKLSKGPSISFDCLRDTQENYLRTVEDAGGDAWVVVNFRTAWSAKEASKRGEKRTLTAFGVRIGDWVKLRQEASRGSIPYAWFEENAVCIPRTKILGGEYGWDLSPIVCAEAMRQEAEARRAASAEAKPLLSLEDEWEIQSTGLTGLEAYLNNRPGEVIARSPSQQDFKYVPFQRLPVGKDEF